MRLHHSNRMESLAAELVRLMGADPGDPFVPERIVVPHPTIGRWLLLELARGLGIAANVRFELPAELAWSLMRAVVPDLSGEQPYTPARLRWRIHDLLAGAHGPPGASGSGSAPGAWEVAVRDYLEDRDARKRLELADRLARMFDQCLLYRPDWIRTWERGSAPHWQARLWQRVAGMDGPGEADHWVRAIDRFHDRLRADVRDPLAGEASAARPSGPRPSVQSPGPFPPPPSLAPSSPSTGSARPSGWPRRVSFFAVPSLSPSYLELLREVARAIEVHLFLLNPCREYWGDIRSRREIDARTSGADPDARYFTEGNELLAAWGRAGRDTLDALVEVEDAQWEEHFVSPAGARRLAAVQRDILDLRLGAEAARADAALAGASGEDEPSAGVPAGLSGETAVDAGSPGGLSGGKGPNAGVPAGPSGETAVDAGSPGGLSGGKGPNAGVPAGPSGETAVEPGSFAVTRGRTRTAPADDSLQIHVCHSPLREAEVLHDRLLALFDAHRDLAPADVLVLTPNLEVYGPAIEAVFSAAGIIPCNVAHGWRGESRTLRALLDLLALPRSRYGAERVLAPLAAPAVRVRFGIGEADLPLIRALVREAGVRWGVDEAHRGEEGLPETPGHTWRQGLRRLLLGYAMEGTDAVVAGLAPCPTDASGFDGMRLAGGEVDGEVLGRFVSYCEGVFGLRDRLAGEHRPARWGKVLRAVVRDFLSDGSEPAHGGSGARSSCRESAGEVSAIRDLVREVEREAEHAEAPVPFEVVLDVLREHAGDASREPARLADGVTVGSLGAGRVVPAEVVCVAGMNDGAFPRAPSFPSFDLVAAAPPRRGDRDLRHEDRFAFLEAFLAARRCFLVTYAGRGLRDDAPIPPSVLVGELKDYVERRFPGAAVETRHPLQPFSPRYFAAGSGEPGGRRTADRAAGGGGNGGESAAAEDGSVPMPEGTRAAGEPFSDSRGMTGSAAADDGSVPMPEGTRAAGEPFSDPRGMTGSGAADDDSVPMPEGTRAAGEPFSDLRGMTGSGAADDDSVPAPEGTWAAGDLFSYSRGMCEAAKAMLAGGAGSGAPGRFAVALPAPDPSRRRVDIADLVAFFANPARFFLRERLGVRLDGGDAALDEEEPFEPTGLERYRLRSEMWEQVWAMTPADRTAALFEGRGRLPHAALGRVVHEEAREEAERLAPRLAPYRAALEALPREIDFELGGFRVVGAIDRIGPGEARCGEGEPADAGPADAGLGEGGSGEGGADDRGPDIMVWPRVGRLRARDRIEVRLRQLAWAAAGHDPVEAIAFSLEKGSWKRTPLPPPGCAREEFEPWLRAWWQGLSAPLPFFPETSYAYAEAYAKAAALSGRDGDDGAAVEKARVKARRVWFGDQYLRGERLDAWHGLVHDDPDPLTGEFEAVAKALLVALVETGRGRVR